MTSFRTIFCIALVLVAVQSRADEFYTLVGYNCDEDNDQLVVYYKGAYNKAGKEMAAHKGENEWFPEALIKSDKDGEFIVSEETIERECDLSHGEYHIRLGPAPGNTRIAGMCGGWVGAWVEVLRRSEVVIPRRAMSSDCDLKDPVTTKITISPLRVFTTMPADDFYR